MIFSKGQLSRVDKEEVHSDGSVIKLVTEYKYLGMILTPQLTFTKHLQRSINKARAKVGYLYQKLNIKCLDLALTIQIFETYVLPIIVYGLGIWWGRVSSQALVSLDAIWTNYLKRWIGVNYSSNNAILYFLTETKSL